MPEDSVRRYRSHLAASWNQVVSTLKGLSADKVVSLSPDETREIPATKTNPRAAASHQDNRRCSSENQYQPAVAINTSRATTGEKNNNPAIPPANQTQPNV